MTAHQITDDLESAAEACRYPIDIIQATHNQLRSLLRVVEASLKATDSADPLKVIILLSLRWSSQLSVETRSKWDATTQLHLIVSRVRTVR